MYTSHLSTPTYATTLKGIPDGVGGIEVTLKTMRHIVRAWKSDPGIRGLATDIVSPVPGKDFVGEIHAIRDWVKENIRYQRDVAGMETIQTPDVTVSLGAGDCDDHAILVCCLLESIGHSTRFFAFGTPAMGNEIGHVFAQTRLGAGWASVETTETVPIGWMPEDITVVRLRHNS
jgi:transglutaminase-like putative cysteine protease